MEKTAYFQKAIDWARKRGLSQIKANWDDYEKPSFFSKPGEEKPYIPDITGEATGNKVFVEIALKSENERQMVSKWRLLSTIAGMKGGKLLLLVPKGHKAYVERILKRYQLISADLYDLA